MITSDYGFLLRLVNTSPIDTDEYCPMCYRVNMMPRPLKPCILFYALRSQIIICIVLGPLKLYWFSAVHYGISLEGYHGTNASEAVQKITTKDTGGVVHQLTKKTNFIATPMKKHT